MPGPNPMGYRSMSAVSYVESSSAASNPISSAIFQHCVVNGELDARTMISDTIRPGFSVNPDDSIFLKSYTKEYLFREVLFLKLQKLLVDEEVWIRNRL